MPPRVTRTKWRCLFPRHDPLLFLYPRWVATAAAAQSPEQPEIRNKAQEQGSPHLRQEAEAAAEGRQDGGRGADVPVPNRRSTPSLIRKVAARQEARQLREGRKKELRSDHLNADDWRTPLVFLRKHTSDDPADHVKQLERLDMPEGMRGSYSGDLHQLFVHVYLQTKCHVQVSRDSDLNTTTFDSLDMAGTRRSIVLAKEILNKAIDLVSPEADENAGSKKSKMDAYQITTNPIAHDGVAPRAVWSTASSNRKFLLQVREPEHWTTTTLANYVDDIVYSEKPRLDREKSATTTTYESHVNAATKKLMHVLLDKKLVPYMSSHACATAMQYLSHHRKIPEIRRVFEALDAEAVFFTPQVFNVLLHSAAEASDMHSYMFLLNMMLDREISPDHETWVALVILVQSRSPRNTKSVITAMKQKSLLDSPSAKIAVANAVLAQEFSTWISRGDSTAEFLGHYDKQWDGQEWLDARAANTMISLRVERGEFADAFSVLEILSSRNKLPNTATLNTFLAAAVDFRDVDVAGQALREILQKHENVRVNATGWGHLGRLAWKTRKWNLLRTVWRYACVAGHVSFHLQRKMDASLRQKIPKNHYNFSGMFIEEGAGTDDAHPNELSRPKIFGLVAARIAVGVDTKYSAQDFEVRGPEQVLAKDIWDGKTVGFEKGFVESFQAARERDREWGLRGMAKGLDLEWMLENAVDVEVDRGRFKRKG